MEKGFSDGELVNGETTHGKATVHHQ